MVNLFLVSSIFLLFSTSYFIKQVTIDLFLQIVIKTKI
jgi:hypothetical protein